MILYIENPEDSTRKLLYLKHELNAVIEYKIILQKSVTFLHTNNSQKNEGNNCMTLASERTKYLGINLTKEVKDLCFENYETLRKEIKHSINK